MPNRLLIDNFIGKEYVYLTIIKEVERKYFGKEAKRCVECICRCGTIITAMISDVISGNTTSCGCRQKERARETQMKHGYATIADRTPEYRVWTHIRQRCDNPNDAAYKNYGGRGIKVCDRWMESFECFLADMGKRPTRKHSLDRYPNNDGNYEPSNCRWTVSKNQNRNKRSNRWIEYNGDRMILQDWADKIGVTPTLLKWHLKKRSITEAIDFFAKKHVA